MRSIWMVALLIALAACSASPTQAPNPAQPQPSAPASGVATMVEVVEETPALDATATPAVTLASAETLALDETPTGAGAPGAVEGWPVYSSPQFGLSFAYPPGWFGPEEYVSGDTLRVEIGSDLVYPYGTSPEERITTQTDSYSIVVQMSRPGLDQTGPGIEATLAAMQDGESVSDARSMIIRVRALQIGRLTGYEYIATLSATAQTEPVYSRSAVLSDGRGLQITLLGSPSAVQASGDWRAAYQRVDADNQPFFEQVLGSLSLQQ